MNKLGASVLHPMELFKSGTSILLVAILFSFSLFLSDRPAPGPHPDRGAAPSALYPLPRFEKNLGQAGSDADFLCRGRNHLLLLGPAGSSLHLLDTGTGDSFIPLRMQVAGARTGSRGRGVNELRSKSNYYIGNDPNSWRTGVPHYERVEYADLYPGIDMTYYFRGQEVEFDFIVAPGADGGAIRLSFAGADKLVTDEEGHLSIHAQGEQLVYHKPLAWQQRAGRTQPVEVQFALLDEKSIGFDIASYDHRAELVIDPQIVYATYLGGSDTDTGNGIAVDPDGCAYVTGSTVSANFPTQNAFQGTLTPGMFSNLSDVFVTKLSADGRDLLYSTYLGGRWDDRGAAIAVDASGRACVTGQTSSDDDAGKPGYQGFPLQRAFQETIGGPNFPDAFVTVLDPYGNLYYSTYLGGEYEDAGTDIAVGADGSLYITGKEFSFDFPVKNAYLEKKPGYYFDAFVTKIDPAKSGAASLIYSTHLGGTADTYGNAIAVDGSGCAYVTGKTSAMDFPTLHAIQPAYQGKGDIFVSKFDPANSGAASLIYSTFLGDAVSNEGLGIAVDAHGCAVVSGYGPVPVTSGAFATPGSAFISKLNAAGTGFLWSARPYNARKLALDPDGNVYTNSSYLYPGAGAGVMALKADGTDTLYTSRIVVVPQDVAVSGSGDVYAAGTTTLEDFPVVNPFQSSLAGKSDLFIVKMAGTVRKTLAVTPDPIYFPLTLPGEIARKSVEIASSGGAAVEIGNIEVEPAALFALENAPSLPLTLKPGEKVEFQIAYAPPAALHKGSSPAATGALTIVSDAEVPIKAVALFAAGIIVNDAGDKADYDLNDGICDTDPDQPGNQCTLRAAIQNVNALGDENITDVYIRIPGSGGGMIRPTAPLPAIDFPVRFDPLEGGEVLLNGSDAGEADGLVIRSGYCHLHLFMFYNWRGHGLRLEGMESNLVERCTFRGNGTEEGPPRAAIMVSESSFNQIRDNVIYSNNGDGIVLSGEAAAHNTIDANWIGYNRLGSSGTALQKRGIVIANGHDNTLSANLIGFNEAGILVESVPPLSGQAGKNRIVDNWIGLDKEGTLPAGNRGNGIELKGAVQTLIENNVAAFNKEGLLISDFSRGTQILHNKIGTVVNGKTNTTLWGNQETGIRLHRGAEDTYIQGNLISGNDGVGIFVGYLLSAAAVKRTTIEKNIIGLDVDGAVPLFNKRDGIVLLGDSEANIIRQNTISGNGANGIRLYGVKESTEISHNRIGTDTSGTEGVANREDGIYILRSANFLIMGNTVSGNENFQIRLEETRPGVNSIIDNRIGPRPDGSALGIGVKKSKAGIRLSHASADIDVNLIAYNETGLSCTNLSKGEIEHNVIRDNDVGVSIDYSPMVVSMNAINQNGIGLDIRNLKSSAAMVTGNHIHGNKYTHSGIHLTDAGAVIAGNAIYADAGDGIFIQGAGTPVIRKNNFLDNRGFALRHTGTLSPVNAQFNWWGATNGPGGSGPGSGDEVDAGVDFSGWRREQVSLFVCPSRDTVLLRTGVWDPVNLLFQNWTIPNDVVTFRVTADKNWLITQEEKTVTLKDSSGGRGQAIFAIPFGTRAGSTARVEVRAVSKTNPAHRDTARFVAMAGSMALSIVTVQPDSIIMSPGDSARFSAFGHNQFNMFSNFVPEWQCSGGTIDDQGLYVAGSKYGEYQVTGRDPGSGLSATARVWIVENTGVGEEALLLPEEFALEQNYPNPFNAGTRIRYSLPAQSRVTIEIFDLLGRRIRTLADQTRPAGSHTIEWAGEDERGEAMPSGLYLYRIRSDRYTCCRKMVLVR